MPAGNHPMTHHPLFQSSASRPPRWPVWTALVGALALVAPLAVEPSIAGGAATEAVRSTINAAIAVLEDKQYQKPEQREARRAKLIALVGSRFDYEEMAKRTLGRDWRKLDRTQQQTFVDLFRSLLVQSYAGRIEGYSGEQVQYENERTRGDYAEVRTRIIAGKVEIPLFYRMILRDGEWRVYDVVVDGISLVRNYRGQFSKILESSSFNELLGMLRDKIKENDQSEASRTG